MVNQLHLWFISMFGRNPGKVLPFLPPPPKKKKYGEWDGRMGGWVDGRMDGRMDQ